MPTQRRIYRGCDFESWNNQQACFWDRAECTAIGGAPAKARRSQSRVRRIDQSLGPCHGRDVIGFDPEAHGP